MKTIPVSFAVGIFRDQRGEWACRVHGLEGPGVGPEKDSSFEELRKAISSNLQEEIIENGLNDHNPIHIRHFHMELPLPDDAEPLFILKVPDME